MVCMIFSGSEIYKSPMRTIYIKHNSYCTTTNIVTTTATTTTAIIATVYLFYQYI